MPRYAAFLRAVNLGRNRRVSGAELRELFEGLGLEDVGPFRTSGNVAFAAGDEDPVGLAARIEAGLSEALGYEVPVFLRSEEEMRAMASHEPFPPEVTEASKGKLQVALLSEPPSAKARKEVLAQETDEDRLAFGERELYWLPCAGTQQSNFDTSKLRELVGLSTVRTQGTIEAMTAKFFAVG